MHIMNHIADIFMLPQKPTDAVVITTNGIVKSDGLAVMGKGIAKIADQKFELAKQLGDYINQYGNRSFFMGVKTDSQTGHKMRVITFPTKHNWRDNSNLNLIRLSAEQLVSTCDKFNVTTCYMTQPGCANGGLNFETQVRPILESILDDRFIVTDYK